MIRIADLRCTKCDSAEIVCIDPGEDEVRDLFLLRRDRPPRCCVWIAGR
jgi:hypothetical protein